MAVKSKVKAVDPKWTQKRDEFLKATVDLHRVRAELAKLEVELVRRGGLFIGDAAMMW